MNRVLLYSVLAVGFVCSASFARASVINGITAPPGGSAVAQSGGGQFSQPVAVNSSTPQANSFATGFFVQNGSISPWASLATTATNVFEGMSVQIQFTSGFDGGGAHTYPFQVTMTNNLPIWHHPIQNVEFSLVNQNVLPADWANIGFTGPYSSTYNGITAVSSKSIMFGGANGGGGDLYKPNTATFTFGLYLPAGIQGAENFYLVMTPNPEPASMLLGAIGLVGGGFLVRRRKKVAATEA